MEPTKYCLNCNKKMEVRLIKDKNNMWGYCVVCEKKLGIVFSLKNCSAGNKYNVSEINKIRSDHN